MQSSPRLRVVFALSSCLAIFCLPNARGQQTYKQSTIGAELTAEEYRNYQLYRVLPPRFQYSTKHGVYIETATGAGGGHGGGGRGTAANDGGNHEGQVLMPRWQAMLRQLVPSGASAGALPSLESLSKMMASWPSRGSSAEPDAEPDHESAEPDAESAEPDHESAEPDAESAAPAAQGSGMLGSLADYWGNMRDTVTGGYGAEDAPAADAESEAAKGDGMLASLANYWTSAQDAVTGGRGVAEKGDGDAAEDAGPGLMASTFNKAKDVATSDLGQEAIKFALGFVPGGGSAVKAYETGNKLYAMSSKADDVADKIPGL